MSAAPEACPVMSRHFVGEDMSGPVARNAPTAPKLALTMVELGQALGLDRATVYRLIKDRTIDIPVFHIGGSARVRLADVEAYLERLAEDARLEQAPVVVNRSGRA
jgi:excisionase family DNA binding protein